MNWEISEETKEIEGYISQKASATILLNNGKKDKITAWFAPSLPFQYGPLEFSGLPGLILAVQRNHYYFYADKISISKKITKIKKPLKGKLISQKEYIKQNEELD